LELSSSPRVPDYDFDLEELSTQRAEMEIREEMAIEKPNVFLRNMPEISSIYANLKV